VKRICGNFILRVRRTFPKRDLLPLHGHGSLLLQNTIVASKIIVFNDLIATHEARNLRGGDRRSPILWRTGCESMALEMWRWTGTLVSIAT
jgi:hypothetical protein